MPRRSPQYLETRREQLLAGARSAFARHGFDGTTVAVLERELGVTRGAIFNYWPNKLAIFMELANRDASLIIDLASSTPGGPRAVLEALIELAARDREWFSVYFEALRVIRRDPALWARWEERSRLGAERMTEAVQRWQAEGSVRTELQPDDVLVLLFVLLDGVLLQIAISPDADVREYAGLPGLVEQALAPAGQPPI
jgi:TetR/AcrR family transcriptional regulator, transcriptional repressor of aconitase